MKNENQRREFLKTTALLGAGATLLGIGVLPACRPDEDEDKKVSPPEDLMQEHGVLNRILLIYDCCKAKIISKESFPMESLSSAATIIREFVEDYHEKNEETHLFTRFQKANQLTDLVDVLLKQHQAGRTITDQILQLTKQSAKTATDFNKLTTLLAAFNNMYRPHEAREDTVLFPAFRALVSQHEYDSLGEEFEQNEHKHFGKNGFEATVNRVAEIEKKLGIYELAQFTPHV